MAWLPRILGGGPRSVFTPLERRLLDELQANLEPPAREILSRRRESINLVQRHFQSSEICCYSRRMGRIYHDPATRFPADAEEMKLATIRFRVPAEKKTWTAEFHLVRGQFFSIDFRPGAQSIQSRELVEVQSVEIHFDPMQPVEAIDQRTSC